MVINAREATAQRSQSAPQGTFDPQATGKTLSSKRHGSPPVWETFLGRTVPKCCPRPLSRSIPPIPCVQRSLHTRGDPGSWNAARGALAEAVRWRQGILPEKKTNKPTKHLDAEIQGGITGGGNAPRELPAGQNRMKARTKHLENNNTTGLLKASPTFLGRGFFSTPTIFFSRQGLYQTAQPKGCGERALCHPPPTAQHCTPHFSHGSFAFSLTSSAQQYSSLTFNMLFQSQLC